MSQLPQQGHWENETLLSFSVTAELANFVVDVGQAFNHVAKGFGNDVM